MTRKPPDPAPGASCDKFNLIEKTGDLCTDSFIKDYYI